MSFRGVVCLGYLTLMFSSHIGLADEKSPGTDASAGERLQIAKEIYQELVEQTVPVNLGYMLGRESYMYYGAWKNGLTKIESD